MNHPIKGKNIYYTDVMLIDKITYLCIKEKNINSYIFVQSFIKICVCLCVYKGQKKWGLAEKVGAGRKSWGCQLGEEKAPWRPHSNLPIFEVGLQGSQRQILYYEIKVSYMEEILYYEGA